ncbi:MAG: zinc-ribbon domain-containing protein [Clostridia bacterium]|nr:zinc-ribbon domain-containing protein [Clostridia bacterium]
MFCSNCGKEMTENDKFCAQCGKYNESYRMPAAAQAPVEEPIRETLTQEPVAPESAVAEPVVAESVEAAPAEPVAEHTSPEVLYTYAQPADEAVPVTAAPAEEPKKEVPAVFGILALIFSIVDSPVGLVFSIIGLCLYKDKTSVHRKRAKAGLIISIVLLALMIVAAIALVIFEMIALENGWVTPLSDPYAFLDYLEYFY